MTSSWSIVITVWLVLCPLFSALEDRYVSNEGIESFLKEIHARYPNITHLYSIGNSTQGRPLWVLAIAAREPSKHLPLRAEVKYIGNIHGNEVVGRDLLLRFIELVTSQTDVTLRRLLTQSRLHVLPSMNPDGFQAATPGDCLGIVGRTNRNGVDLNRNFPEYFSPQPEELPQAETRAIMRWLEAIPFVLSTSYHGGAFVASYSFDNYNCTHVGCKPDDPFYSVSPDDALLRHFALTYAGSNARMARENACPDAGVFKRGITNGAQWYPLYGGMQDYNYVRHGVLELTLEVSCCKYPLNETPSVYWEENRASMISFYKHVTHGIRGYVTYRNGSVAVGAHVDIVGKRGFVKSTKDGEFWKILQPGSHLVQAVMRGQLMSEAVRVHVSQSQDSLAVVNFTLSLPDVTSGSGDQFSARTAGLLSLLTIFLSLILV